MKKLILTTIATSTLLLSSGAFAMDKDLEDRLVDVCEAIKSDSRIALHSTLKHNRFRADSVVEGLVCNGEDAITFAKLHGAERTANLLIKRSGNQGKIVVIEDLAKN